MIDFYLQEAAAQLLLSKEPKSSEEGACFKWMVNRKSPSEGACLRYMMNRCRQMWGHLYDDPLSSNEGARLTCMMSRNRQMRGLFKIWDEPLSPNEGRVQHV